MCIGNKVQITSTEEDREGVEKRIEEHRIQLRYGAFSFLAERMSECVGAGNPLLQIEKDSL